MAADSDLVRRAEEQGGLAVRNGDVGDKLAAGEDRDVVDGGAGQSFDLQVELHADLARLLYRGRRLQGQAEILVLNLRDGDGGAGDLIQEARGADSIDGDSGERG